MERSRRSGPACHRRCAPDTRRGYVPSGNSHFRILHQNRVLLPGAVPDRVVATTARQPCPALPCISPAVASPHWARASRSVFSLVRGGRLATSGHLRLLVSHRARSIAPASSPRKGSNRSSPTLASPFGSARHTSYTQIHPGPHHNTPRCLARWMEITQCASWHRSCSRASRCRHPADFRERGLCRRATSIRMGSQAGGDGNQQCSALSIALPAIASAWPRASGNRCGAPALGGHVVGIVEHPRAASARCLKGG